MKSPLFSLPADLFLGSDRATALAQGPRTFTSTEKALRFALEQAAPVSLRGATLHAGNRRFGPAEMVRLHARLTA